MNRGLNAGDYSTITLITIDSQPQTTSRGTNFFAFVALEKAFDDVS